MVELYQKERHEPLAADPWNEDEVLGAIREIVAGTVSAFDAQKLWPSHPLDGVPDGIAGVYLGAAGTILALEYLKRAGAADFDIEFAPVMPTLVDRDNVWLKNIALGKHASLLMGDLGTHLVAMCLSPDSRTADFIHDRVADNDVMPTLELMWGTAGSMLSCVFLDRLTSEVRFQDRYREQATRLIGEVEKSGPLWTQELPARNSKFLGLVHGFAGNMLALLQGWEWLTPEQRKTAEETATEVLATYARRDGIAANWPTDADRPDDPLLCQICHGAPGIVMALAEAPFRAPPFDDLLVAGGELVWQAGPLKKGSNFCHGTGGNAYALLKLYKRTGDPIWLERARALSMAAIAQMRAARAEYGRYRFPMGTGDTGLAICLWSAITGEPKFPGIDGI